MTPLNSPRSNRDMRLGAKSLETQSGHSPIISVRNSRPNHVDLRAKAIGTLVQSESYAASPTNVI